MGHVLQKRRRKIRRPAAHKNLTGNPDDSLAGVADLVGFGRFTREIDVAFDELSFAPGGAAHGVMGYALDITKRAGGCFVHQSSEGFIMTTEWQRIEALFQHFKYAPSSATIGGCSRPAVSVQPKWATSIVRGRFRSDLWGTRHERGSGRHAARHPRAA